MSNLVFGENKPNILWITIEDSSPQFFGCYGNKNARTPVVYKLAESGVRFIDEHINIGLCNPSRNSLFTGV